MSSLVIARRYIDKLTILYGDTPPTYSPGAAGCGAAVPAASLTAEQQAGSLHHNLEKGQGAAACGADLRVCRATTAGRETGRHKVPIPVRPAWQRVQVGRPAPQSPHPGTPLAEARGAAVIPEGMAISHRRLWRSLALVYKRAWSASFALRRAFIFNAAAGFCQCGIAATHLNLYRL